MILGQQVGFARNLRLCLVMRKQKFKSNTIAKKLEFFLNPKPDSKMKAKKRKQQKKFSAENEEKLWILERNGFNGSSSNEVSL